MKAEIPKTYNPQEVEGRWYQWWESKGFFRADAGFFFGDAAAKCHRLAAYGPYAQQHGPRRDRAAEADAGIQYPLASRHGPRRYCHAERRGKGASKRGFEPPRPWP